MAKWGEGDPRWIVEERPDATNVNNWHWTEKNADQWSKKKLTDLFTNLAVCEGTVIESLDKCEGEARANNRKAKLIFFYEWELEMKWSHAEKDIKGTITIPNLSEEHTDMKDVDISVSITSNNNDDARAIKEMLRVGKGAQMIREQLEKYVHALKSEYSQGLILPQQQQQQAAQAPSAAPVKPKSATSTTSSSKGAANDPALKNLNIGVSIPVSEITIEEVFKCTGQELYNAITQKDMLQVFTNGPVKMEASEAKAGEHFELLDGNIQGSYLEVCPFSKVVQKWRLKSWPAGHFSHVEIEIKQTKDDTRVNVKQKNVPTKELESTKMGWSRYYWESIRRSFGFGNALF